MNISFFQLRTLALLLALTGLASCNKDADPKNEQSTGTLKLTQNGQVITEVKDAIVSGVGGGGYEITIASPDNKHNIVLSIQGKATGKYPFINSSGTETLTSGKANFLYQSPDLPPVYEGTDGVLIPGTGELTLTTATSTRCAGTFTGSGKNVQDGKTYSVEGSFDTPVVE